MKSNPPGRQKLSRTLSRTFSLRCFQSKKVNGKTSESIPKEISVETREENRVETSKDISAGTRKEVSFEDRTKTTAEARKDIILDLPSKMKMKNLKERSKDCQKEISIDSLWTSPGSTSRHQKNTKSCHNLETAEMNRMTVPILMSPASKKPFFSGRDLFEDYERIIASDESSAKGNGKAKAWKLEPPPFSSSKATSPYMLSRASPSRGVNRYASTNNLMSVHATPVRRTMQRQASVFIPKADLDDLCNMYEDIVDPHFRSR